MSMPPSFLSDAFCGAGIITGQHRDLNTSFAQGRERPHCRRTRSIRDCDQTDGKPAFRDMDYGATRFLQPVRLGRETGEV